VKRLLIRSPSFVRAAKRFVKKRPDNGAELQKALTLLEIDVFHPNLKAHKLRLQRSEILTHIRSDKLTH
jgi:mRNA-degrading endonuclease YafQ of YafQ-DinJ toxin-antitoxin module